tara:strand:- start:100 stop:2727 length:2628 start_codon:yes stop_codon:yes gene_type:complete
MRKLLYFIPIILFAHSFMHPEDPKERNHNSLGFGVAGDVAISEGVFYVSQTGSSLNNGSVYVYSPNSDNVMEQELILPPIQNELGFDFGYSIDVYKDILIIGAPHRADKTGRAFIYKRDQLARWQLIQVVEPNIREWTSDFGSEVAVSEKYIMIADRDAGLETGAVFSLVKNEESGSWEEGTVIRNTSINEDGFFGHSIDIEGDQALIGSRNGNIAVAYTFSEGWKESYVFSPYYFQSEGRFGFSVDLDGDYAVISSPGFNNKGIVEIHRKSDETWERIISISNPDPVDESYFGADVSISGDEILIGNYNGEKSYVFHLENDLITLKHTLQSPENFEGKFGRALSFVDDKILIGATYGQKAHIYNKDSNGSWILTNDISSHNRTKSITGKKVPCAFGKSGRYSCKSLDMLSFITPGDLSGGKNTELNDIWGWTDSTTDKEYALVGLRIGTSFVDVSDPVNPVVLGFLPTTTTGSSWRDMKVYKDHVYIVADNVGNHGVQVFDLTQLRSITQFTEFTMTYHYDLVGSVHNIAINEQTGFAYATGIGSSTPSEYRCGGGLHMMDLSDPALPTFAGCFAHDKTGRSGTGYTHDAQIVIYNGPDSDYQGKEIAFSSNETALSIADISDKANPKIITKFDNFNFGYVHQGWLSEDHRYFFVNDELNESRGYDDVQTTVIFDLGDLDDPIIVNTYRSELNTIDHNNYVKGDLLFQSNYSSGLRILSIADPTNPIEVAHFDTYIAGDAIDFIGSWSNYPYFSSGTIVMTSIEEGLYILKASDGGNLDIDKGHTLPDKFNLKQNYPNPFNPTTKIQYDLPVAGEISINVYNTLGILVMKLDSGYKTAGSHLITFNADKLPTGIYFYQLQSGNFVETKKMTLIK